jgi:uncharacterized membrane protein
MQSEIKPILKRITERVSLTRQAVLVITMILSTILCFVVFGLRASKAHNLVYASLNWNLFLAWIPAGVSLIAYNVYRKGSCVGAVVALGCAAVWLLFFPNAPYLLTDLVHLRPMEEVPYWLDQLVYLAYAWTGCYLGLVSLLLMQALVRRSINRWVGWIFSFSAIILSGFGIYLGRFQRFNSWDFFLQPKLIWKEVLDWVLRPKHNMETYTFSILFSLFFGMVYIVLVAILNLKKEDLV